MHVLKQSVESLQTHLLSVSLCVLPQFISVLRAGWSVRLAEQLE